MKLSLLNRFLNVFALILHLTAICSGVEVNLQKEKFEGCKWVLLDDSKTHIAINCEESEIDVIENFSEFVPAGGIVNELSVTQSNFSELVDNLLSKMGFLEIEVLSFRHCNIRKINNETFKGGDTIKSLDLAENSIQSLDPDVFRFLINLESLNLNENKILRFQQNTVFPNVKLQALSLSRNQIVNLNVNLFSKLNNLNTLKLGSNKLEYLDVKILSLPRISYVAISDNRWQCNCGFRAIVEFLQMKKTLHLRENWSISCRHKGVMLHVNYLIHHNWTHVKDSCTPGNIFPTKPEPTKLNATHLCCILLATLLVIALAALAGMGFWIKKRTVMENGRVKFVRMTEDEE